MSKNKKKICIIAAAIVLISCLAIVVYVFTGYGISQTKKTIELGDTFNVNDFIKVSNGSRIESYSREQIDTSKLGKQTLQLTVSNRAGKRKTLNLDFDIVDTTLPVITNNDIVIYVKKGGKLDLSEHINVEDKDKNISLQLKDKIDMNKVGEYTSTVKAVDSSGNSAEKAVKIIIENRENLTFRETKWNDTKEVVKRYETAELTSESKDQLVYKTTLNGQNVALVYQFDNGKLKGTGYWYDNYALTNKKVDYYKSLKKSLTKVYGKPDRDERRKLSSLAYYTSDDFQALELGYVDYVSIWHTDYTTIGLHVDRGDNYRVEVVLLYFEKSYEKVYTEGL